MPTTAPASDSSSGSDSPSAGWQERLERFPPLRFMGSKVRLLPWIAEVLSGIEFSTALDAFAGSGAVAYLLKAMGKRVTTNDFLHFSATNCRALVENSTVTLSPAQLQQLCEPNPRCGRFIERTFEGIFFTPEDLRFLDRVSANLDELEDPLARAVGRAALVRSCAKRQPRGVFTVAGDPARYKDGRRDLKLSIEEHFCEQVEAYGRAVFSNGHTHRVRCGDVFGLETGDYDLVYLDPPYVPRADDNCYMKRYHFLEGLSRYWRGVSILEESRVKKIVKPYTPFSYRREAVAAFERLFDHFAQSTLVLSYSSNGYPDLDVLVALMERGKPHVEVFERDHRYHFGTHSTVRRTAVREYLIVGR